LGHKPALRTEEGCGVGLCPQRVDLADRQREGLGHEALDTKSPRLPCDPSCRHRMVRQRLMSLRLWHHRLPWLTMTLATFPHAWVSSPAEVLAWLSHALLLSLLPSQAGCRSPLTHSRLPTRAPPFPQRVWTTRWYARRCWPGQSRRGLPGPQQKAGLAGTATL